MNRTSDTFLFRKTFLILCECCIIRVRGSGGLLQSYVTRVVFVLRLMRLRFNRKRSNRCIIRNVGSKSS